MVSIYRALLGHFGPDTQLSKLSEECLELGCDALHYRDGKIDVVKLAEEVADVEIMCGQIRELIGHPVVNNAKVAKLERSIARYLKPASPATTPV